MPKKKAIKKSFTPEAKAETLRLIRDEGWTAKQAAELTGCSISAITLWKTEAKAGKFKVAAKATTNGTGTAEPAVKSVKKGKKGKRRRKSTTKGTVATAPIAKPSITFDEFVQGYWKKCDGASDVLRLPPDIMPKAVQYVNNVLRYAYSWFGGQ
jgi:transposase-like protein